MNPPPLLRFEDFDGNWVTYESALYNVFERDIVQYDLQFRGIRVSARRVPEYEQRWFCYWHLISEGRVEDDRLPDLRRCERLPWIRWIIENADNHPEIDVWEQTRGSEKSLLLWYQEECLVILGRRSDYFLLKTAFVVQRSHRISKFRKERDLFFARAQNG